MYEKKGFIPLLRYYIKFIFSENVKYWCKTDENKDTLEKVLFLFCYTSLPKTLIFIIYFIKIYVLDFLSLFSYFKIFLDLNGSNN